MALNIKNPEVESLATELAHLSNTTKTEAIRIALLERKERASFLVSGTGREGPRYAVEEMTELKLITW